MTQDIDLALARRIAVDASGLGTLEAQGAAGAAAAIRHLSALQIDTISVVERAHHHILWSRVPRYRQAQLARLEAEPRRIIEYWSHAAAYIPIEEYRFCIPRMERVRERGHDWFDADRKAVAMVRKRIRAEGPLRVQDFEGPKRGSAGWWDWKPAKVALEYLFHAGELVSLGREGFQKRYDLAERALPAGIDLRRPGAKDMAAFYVDIAARTLGVFTETDVAYQRKDMTEGIADELAQRVESGALVRLGIEGAGGVKAWFAAPELLDRSAAGAPAGGARVFLLSPFDPLVIDRRRTRRLFGMEFQIECYIPAAKRRFGYFALPLLYREASGEVAFVGRLDAKADREAGTLILRRLALTDPPKRRPSSLVAALAGELMRYARFTGCERLELGSLEAGDEALVAAVRDRLEAVSE